MNAYTHFHRSTSAQKEQVKTTFRCKESPYMVDLSNQPALFGPQLKFLNSGACQYVNPYSRTFWPDLNTWLLPISRHAAAYPKAPSYRRQLEPYLLRKVVMTARSWKVLSTKEPNGLLRLTLIDVCLSHVYSNSVGASPNIFVDHMNVWVSPEWFNKLSSHPYGVPLTITGVLYEYVSKNTRNIGVLPILMKPAYQFPAVLQNCPIKPPDRECPGAFA